MTCGLSCIIDWIKSIFVSKFKIKYKLRAPDYAFFGKCLLLCE